MCRDKILAFEKSFENKIANISKSIFQEILFVLSTFCLDANKYTTVDTVDNTNAVVISNINYYNAINKLGLYNLTLLKQSIVLRQSDIKNDLVNINKRHKYLSSILISELNKNKILKLDKINKNMSDSEISEIKKTNKMKESVVLKLHNKIKGMKISTCI